MKTLTLTILLTILLVPATCFSQNKGCANILNDPRAYGNWQNSRQQSDYNSIQRQNSWGNYLEKSGQPSWVVDDARAKQKLMENAAESSRRHNEFFGPHNKYGK